MRTKERESKATQGSRCWWERVHLWCSEKMSCELKRRQITKLHNRDFLQRGYYDDHDREVQNLLRNTQVSGFQHTLRAGLQVTRRNIWYLFIYLLTTVSSLAHIHLIVKSIYTLCTNHQNISYIEWFKNSYYCIVLYLNCMYYQGFVHIILSTRVIAHCVSIHGWGGVSCLSTTRVSSQHLER